jgi:hypothetical protein
MSCVALALGEPAPHMSGVALALGEPAPHMSGVALALGEPAPRRSIRKRQGVWCEHSLLADIHLKPSALQFRGGCQGSLKPLQWTSRACTRQSTPCRGKST